ncbi:MAG: methionine synthase, partial [Dysgonamonadaceae bacterium]|nr:methionine synthase [Dysgonamonadaceae bacterium]
YVPDASLSVPVANKLLSPQTKEQYIREVKADYHTLREKSEEKPKTLVSLDYARKHPFRIDWTDYTPPQPSFLGHRIVEIPLNKIIPYIHWQPFLAAWKFPVRYAAYLKQTDAKVWVDSFPKEEQAKVQEAIRLIDDAKEKLNEWSKNDSIQIQSVIGFYPATAADETLFIQDPQSSGSASTPFPLLRQQEQREDDTYKSLVDFIQPSGDYIGLFVTTVKQHSAHFSVECKEGCKHETDTYQNMLAQILRDRLAEASAEYLHEKVRTDYWGYAPNEVFTLEELFKEPYRGIRPASGYPSLPDLSFNFVIDKFLNMQLIGVNLTPNGAMDPTATVAGMYLAHPAAGYFYIGTPDEQQIKEYASKKGISVEETKKWLGL